MSNAKGTILILLSTIAYGSYGVWSKLIGDSFGNFFQGWTRGLILVLVLLPILLYKKQIVPIQRKDWRWLSFFLIFASLTQAPIFYAYNNMDINSASLLFFTCMLLTMYLFGFIFLGEKFTKTKIISFVLALIGLYLVFSFSLIAFTLLAVLMAVINGITSGGEIASSKKLTGNYSTLYVTWLSWVIITITNLPLSVLFGEVQHLPSLELAWLFQLGYTFTSLFASWFVIAGLKYVEVSIGGLIGLLEIIFSILLGILIFGEILTPKLILGGTLILVASAMPHISDLFFKYAKKKHLV